MNKLMLSFATLLLFTLTGFAQSTANPNSGMQGTQDSSPAMQQQQTPSSDSGMNNSNMPKKLRGCIAQQNGQYVLQTKHGKTIPLSGQDVSAHVGHTVALHGTWAGSNAGTQTSTGAASDAASSFEVTKVDMISDSCNAGGAPSGSNNTTPQQ